jgi:hypothetical protein
MATIVGVHGAFHELWGPQQVAARWVPAISDGVTFAGGSVARDDVAIAFYGDLFRPAAGDRTTDDVTELARRAGLLDLIEDRLGADGLALLADHIGREQLQRTLAQLGRYFGDDDVRAAVQARVRSAISDDTRVVVAHSLGSVVAYEVLVALDAGPTVDLVTIGSPLGRAALIGERVRPPYADGVGRRPAKVRRWTDIASVGDPVAEGHPVAACVAGVVSVRVDNGHRAHDPEPYLCARETGVAVLAGLTAESRHHPRDDQEGRVRPRR